MTTLYCNIRGGALALLIAAFWGTARAEVENPNCTVPPTSSTLFALDKDHIKLLGWDGHQTSAALLVITPDQFEEPKVVRENRLIIISENPVLSEAFLVPPSARFVTVVFRSRDYMENWPRIRLTMEPIGEDPATAKSWDSWMLSRVMTRKQFAVPVTLRDQPCLLKLQLLNPDPPTNASGKACFVARVEFE